MVKSVKKEFISTPLTLAREGGILALGGEIQDQLAAP